tara:strand:- start:4979 stop:5290 length:312 start_codon:yes stop_codon:yes gene_type:complete
MAKKRNIIKDLKKMGLVPTTKQHKQIMNIGIWILVLGFVFLSFYGMYKYPTPPHYFENMNYPANHYSNVAYIEECECGNDPSCYPIWWYHPQNKVEEKYRYYV